MPEKKKGKIHIKDPSDPRDLALIAFYMISEEGKRSDTVLRTVLSDFGSGLSGSQKAFVERLSLTALRREITIDGILGRYLKKPLRLQRPLVRSVLRLALAEILYMDSVPDYAALNESVGLMKLHGMDGLSGMVNAVLRHILRDRESGPRTFLSQDDECMRYSLPQWLIDRMKKRYPETNEEVLEAMSLERAPSLRFNLSAVNADDPEAFICESLESEGCEIEKIDMDEMIMSLGIPHPSGRLPVMYESRGGDISESKAFSSGLISIQDPSSALAASFADPGENDYVIDVCAAPGGKSLSFADLMGGGGRIDARDISPSRMKLTAENVRRCGFRNIHMSVADALHIDEESLYRADIVCADLPCTGLGVMARKPDIRFHVQERSFSELQNLQRDILSTVSRYVKPRGKLLYSTCTMSAEENEENTAWIEEVLGFDLLTEADIRAGKHHDGFYTAVLRRRR